MVADVGRYPPDAFLFVRDGLNYAVEHVHGPETRAHQVLAKFLLDNELDWNDLVARYHTGQLPEPVVQVIDEAGGPDTLNRHIGGRELCWALRDYALERWGFLAKSVLASWKILGTLDFGRVVFAFIDHNLMQKQEGDTLEDFEDVYAFAEAFDETFHIRRGDEASPDSE